MPDNDYVTIPRAEYERLMGKSADSRTEMMKRAATEVAKEPRSRRLEDLTEQQIKALYKILDEKILDENPSTDEPKPTEHVGKEQEEPSQELTNKELKMSPEDYGGPQEEPKVDVIQEKITKKRMPVKKLKDMSSEDAVRKIMGDFGSETEHESPEPELTNRELKE